MAFGRHWEWRGFGPLPASLRTRLVALPLKYPQAQQLVDEYLWVPGVAINVKLRFSNFKLKRLLESRGQYQLWLEDPAEDYPFPLAAEVVLRIARELGLTVPRPEQAVYHREAILKFLGAGSPGVRVVAVSKARWQHQWSPAPGDPGAPVTVELAEIDSPEQTTSVGVEHPRLDAVQRACEELGLESALAASSYLEALDRWVAGRSAAGS